MPLVEAACPNCGATLKLDRFSGQATCPYCGSTYFTNNANTPASRDYVPKHAKSEPYEPSYSDETYNSAPPQEVIIPEPELSIFERLETEKNKPIPFAPEKVKAFIETLDFDTALRESAKKEARRIADEMYKKIMNHEEAKGYFGLLGAFNYDPKEFESKAGAFFSTEYESYYTDYYVPYAGRVEERVVDYNSLRQALYSFGIKMID